MSSPIKLQRPSAEFPRKYVPLDADLGNWNEVEVLLKELCARLLDTVEELEQWLLDKSEFSACLAEEGARRSIEMTCATEDEEKEQRHLHMITNIWPQVKPYTNQLAKNYYECAARKNLDADYYGIFDRKIATAIELYREENISIEKELSQLAQQFQKAAGAITVEWEGEEKTLPQMRIFSEATERDVRERAWRLTNERRLKEAAGFNDLFEKMIPLRNEVARNAGFENYLQYVFPVKNRFDYSPENCIEFHEAVESCAVPFMRKLDKRRREQLGVDALRPWDLKVDASGRAPLKPFKDGADMAERSAKIFHELDPQLGEWFQLMIDEGLLDLDSRKGKAPGGYQANLSEMRLPFIFMNASGTDGDVWTMLHEAGHAFHSFSTREVIPLEYRHAPMEFCEVASMGMEMLCIEKLAAFYNDADAARSLRGQLEGAIIFFPWCATIDAFQHWIYQNPNHSREERAAYWLQLMERFGHDVDWSGFEKIREMTWQSQLHLFCYPFYYIEYGIAQLGALQIWMNARKDPAGTLTAYKKALKLGGTKTLPQLFEAAGLKFDMTKNMMGAIVEEVEAALAELPS